MDTPESRMRAAFELHELAVAMRRQALVREHPDERAEQIEVRLRQWLLQPAAVPLAAPDRQAMAEGSQSE